MTAHWTAPEGMRFTPDRYENLLTCLLDEGYAFVGYDDPGPGEVILRHDVTLSPQRALATARIDADLGVASTYCVLGTAPVYDLLDPRHFEAMRRIEALGHDVGLHVDTQRLWDDRPDDRTLVEAVTREMDVLDRLTDDPVEVVSFHAPPTWTLDLTVEAFTNACAPRYVDEIAYRSDADQQWRARRPFAGGVPETVQLVIHPGLWEPRDRALSAIVDDVADRTHHRVTAYLDRLDR